MTALTIEPAKVSHVNVAGQWIRVAGYRLLAVAIAGAKPTAGIEAYDRDNGVWVYLAADQVHGVRTTERVKTPEEVEAERQEAEQEAAALFHRLHRTDKTTYDAAVANQSGRCAGCTAALADFAITHHNGEDGSVLCQGCSPFVHRC